MSDGRKFLRGLAHLIVGLAIVFNLVSMPALLAVGDPVGWLSLLAIAATCVVYGLGMASDKRPQWLDGHTTFAGPRAVARRTREDLSIGWYWLAATWSDLGRW